MSEHIPFISGIDANSIASDIYKDSNIFRIPQDKMKSFKNNNISSSNLWLDPCVDGLDDLDTRRPNPTRVNSWYEYMAKFPHFDDMGTSSFQRKPVTANVNDFVDKLLNKSASYKPAWLTVPQLPLVTDSSRNKINRALAIATGDWKSKSGYSGRLILPIIITHQKQLIGKTARNPKVQQAKKCYHDTGADGFWVVDKSLQDDCGSGTLRSKRFPAIIAFHEELNVAISSKIRISGPYWGMNLVLWARGLVDFPAIGIGSGYQFYLSGGHAKQPHARIALPSLRRRVTTGPPLKKWLDLAISELSASHPARKEFQDIRKHISVLSQKARAREQVADAYKQWYDSIASAPKAGRSMALFQDLSNAYALGKSLPVIEAEGTARRPEAIAESLMLSCL